MSAGRESIPMIVDEFDRPAPERIDLLRGVNPNDLGHERHFGHSSPAIRYMETAASASIVGPALPVRIPPEDGTMVHKAVELARPGDVLVIDAGGHTTNAPWGDVTTRAAIENGVVAAVIDGAVTDTADVAALDFPVFARARSTRTARGLGIGGDVGVAVSAGGAVVEPGDVALGNEEGVLFVPAAEIEAAAEYAVEKREREREIVERIEAGESLADLSGANERIERAEDG